MPSRRSLALVALSVCCLAFAAWRLTLWIGSDAPNAHLPSDFPHAYLAAQDYGKVDRVHVIKSRMPPESPAEVDGVEVWPTYACTAEDCRGRSGNQDFIFAFTDDPDAVTPAGPWIACPLCTAPGQPATAQDVSPPRRWYTAEGQAIIDAMYADWD